MGRIGPVFGRGMSSITIRASPDSVLAAKPGRGSEMSQTTQQQGAVAGSPRPRKDWELFWRIIAGLMLLIIAWALWVLYQITPRSVVTPLAYANPIRSIGTHQAAIGAAAAVTAQPAVTPPAPASAQPAVTPPAPAAEATPADVAMDRAQAAARAGAHQASADVRASSPEKAEQPIQGVGLRLATEMSTPAAEKPASLKTPEGRIRRRSRGGRSRETAALERICRATAGASCFSELRESFCFHAFRRASASFLSG